MAPVTEPGYEDVRRRLEERGYLRGRIERFVLRDVLTATAAGPSLVRSAARAALVGGPVLGALLAATVAVSNRPLVRAIDRLQGNLAISVPTLSQIAAAAAFDGRAEMDAIKHGYEENRRILLDGLPQAGLDTFLPVDGAFYLYADVSRFSNDSFDFARRMLAETHVAATPGVDFDPLQGGHFLRFCYAGAAADMHEAVERIATWLKR